MTDEATAARAFYRDTLCGYEVWRTEDGEARRGLSFIVGETLFDVSADVDGDAPDLVLYVDDPGTLAERCWDAGYGVRVHDDAAGRARLSVMDPFGRRVELLARPDRPASRPAAGEGRD